MLKPDQIGVVACQDDFYVDEQTCLCCDAPPAEAPDLMRLGEENCFFYMQPGTQNEIERACRAINVSCVEGVRYRGQNRAILRRLFDLGSYASCDVVPTESEREAAVFVQAHIGRTKGTVHWTFVCEDDIESSVIACCFGPYPHTLGVFEVAKGTGKVRLVPNDTAYRPRESNRFRRPSLLHKWRFFVKRD